jgi:uncharacterized protein (DUF427 family)
MAHYPRHTVQVNHVEPVPRRIRAFIGDVCALDTLSARYVWEWPNYPQYYVPLADVNAAVLAGDGQRRLGSEVGAELAGTVRFPWDAFDRWFEEDEEVFVHPRSPYVRVDALRSTRSVRIELEGTVLAASRGVVMVFETGLPTRYYFNRTEVNFACLQASDTVTACPYKGRTSGYWSSQTAGPPAADIAWSYDFPTAALAPIAGLIAFYNEKVDVIVEGE